MKSDLNPITQNGFDAMRRHFTKEYFRALSKKAGGKTALLEMTQGKPRGQVEFVIGSLFPEEEANSGLIEAASLYLVDQEYLMEGLGALPWGDSD